jgi:hypothetical protein
MAIMEGIFVLAFAAILSSLLPTGTQWSVPSLKSPHEILGSPNAPAVLPRPARPGVGR